MSEIGAAGAAGRPALSLALPEGGLRDGEVLVRHVARGDARALQEAIAADESISLWTRIPWPYTAVHAAEFVARADLGWSYGTDAACVIVDLGTAAVTGGIGLHRIGGPSEERSSFMREEIGYWLTPGARGRGFATRALAMLSRWAILDAGVPSINLQTKAGNDASRRVALRVGYRFVRRVGAGEVDDDMGDHDRYVLSASDLTAAEPAG